MLAVTSEQTSNGQKAHSLGGTHSRVSVCLIHLAVFTYTPHTTQQLSTFTTVTVVYL